MSKRLVIMVVCVILIAGTFLTLTIPRRKSQPLASFTYIGTVTNLTVRYGRFSISNCCDKPIHYMPGLVQLSDGTFRVVQSPGLFSRELQPHCVETFDLAVPEGTSRWRGLLNVGQEKKGLASLPLRLKSFLRYGFRYGAFSPSMGFRDGRRLATPEVEE